MKRVSAANSPKQVRTHTGPRHGPGMMVPGEKAKDFKGTFRRLLKYLGRYKFSILAVMLFAMASTVFSIVGPKILGTATTKLFEGVMNIVSGNGQGIDYAYILNVILFLAALYLVSAAFSYIQGFIMTGISMKVTYLFRRDIADKIHKLPFHYYDTTSNGEVLSRITNDVDAVSQTRCV